MLAALLVLAPVRVLAALQEQAPTNHDDALGLRVLHKPLQAVDKVGACTHTGVMPEKRFSPAFTEPAAPNGLAVLSKRRKLHRAKPSDERLGTLRRLQRRQGRGGARWQGDMRGGSTAHR